MNIRLIQVAVLLISLALLAPAAARPPRTVQASGVLCTVSPMGGADYMTIQAAVNDIHCDSIQLADGVYVENVVIARNLVLQGTDPDRTIIDGGRAGSVVLIQQGATVSIAQVTIRHGLGYGGGIANEGMLIVSDSTISDNTGFAHGGLSLGGGIFNVLHGSMTLSNTMVISNTVIGESVGISGLGFGGGIANTGALTITASTIANNTASHGGGGIFNSGSLTVTDSTLAGSTSGVGGGIMNEGTMTLMNDTLSANRATFGGGISNSTILSITNTTIVSNTATASERAGGIDNLGTTRLRNTIIAYNQQADCRNAGTLISQGHNLSADNSCTFTTPADKPNTNPQLASLQDNGGSTLTHALAAGSPAIDAGANDGCPARDQRSVRRPVDGDGDGVAICDIGSYEVSENLSPPTPTLTPSPSSTPSPTSTPEPSSTPSPTPTAIGASPRISTIYLPIVGNK